MGGYKSGTHMIIKPWQDNSFENWIYESGSYVFHDPKANKGQEEPNEPSTKTPMLKGFNFYKGMKVSHVKYENCTITDFYLTKNTFYNDYKPYTASYIGMKLQDTVGKEHKIHVDTVLDDASLITPISIFKIELLDITKSDCDAIVNSTNSALVDGGGIDDAIHDAAGPELMTECTELGGCELVEAKITKGYNLPAKYIIHTVGPTYTNDIECKSLLSQCYLNILNLAKQNNIHTIAIPSISTGIKRFPIAKASKIALKTYLKWVGKNLDYDIKVTFTCYTRDDFDAYVYTAMQYIQDNSYEQFKKKVK